MAARHCLVVLTLLGVLVSCDNSPGSIAGPSVEASGRIEIVAPPTIEPGATVQLTANLITSGGAENVTRDVQWASTDDRVLQVSAAGVATGVGRGEVVVTALRQYRTASAQVMVIPAGTFRLTGLITDGGFVVPGVTLTVVSGVGEGLSASTGPAGQYAFYGVAGPVTIRATKAGYLDRIETLGVEGHRSLNLEMAPAGPRPDLSGSYVLTLEAQECSGRLPEDARRRSYEASVQQDGRQLTVRLTGADFIVVNNRGDRFTGTLGPDDVVRFVIGDDFFSYYGYYTTPNPGFVERLDDHTSLVINGTVTAPSSPTRISGSLAATIGLVGKTAPPFWPFFVMCHSSRHLFDMRRK